MKGKIFFLQFFILFTLASLAIPVPMFPGSMILTWFRVPLGFTSSSLLSAIVNGAVYGFIIWLVSGLAFKALSMGSSVSLVESKNRAEVAMGVDREMDTRVEGNQLNVDSTLLVVADETRGVGRLGCPYRLGYLRNHLKGIPDECLMCPELMECLGLDS